MTGNFSTDIIVIYVPVLLAIVMGILGALRGARREAVVSGSIILGGLILIVWIGPWSLDLHNLINNLSVSDSRSVLTYPIMALTVIVAGYMLGSALVSRTPISALSRIGGLLLGVVNGLAIGGYFIRGPYDLAVYLSVTNSEFTDFTLSDTLRGNTIARSLWIGSNWFPLAIAIIAAVVALIGPFRRAQTTVATPAARTDWGPAASPAAVAASGQTAYPTGYGQGFTSQYPQQPAQPQYAQPAQYGQQYPQQYGQAQAPTQAQQYVPSPAAQQYGQYNPPPSSPPPAPAPVYAPPTSYTPAPPAPSRVEDAPPTTLMPTDTPRASTPGGQETLYIGSTGPKPNTDTDPNLKAPEWPGYTSEPSWLSPAASSSSLSSSSTPVTPPALADNSLVARSEAPTVAQPLVTPSTISNADSSTPTPLSTSSDSDGPDAASFVNCARCGTLVPADATFCTECGNRMKA